MYGVRRPDHTLRLRDAAAQQCVCASGGGRQTPISLIPTNDRHTKHNVGVSGFMSAHMRHVPRLDCSPTVKRGYRCSPAHSCPAQHSQHHIVFYRFARVRLQPLTAPKRTPQNKPNREAQQQNEWGGGGLSMRTHSVNTPAQSPRTCIRDMLRRCLWTTTLSLCLC